METSNPLNHPILMEWCLLYADKERTYTIDRDIHAFLDDYPMFIYFADRLIEKKDEEE